MQTSTLGQRALITAGVLCAMSAIPVSAQAGWSDDPRVNAPVVTDTNDTSWNMKMVSDGTGGAYYVWDNTVFEDADPTGIFTQRVDREGNPLWSAGGEQVCVGNQEMTEPVITTDGAGGMIVAWLDSRLDNAIYAQRLSADGEFLWQACGKLVVRGESTKSDLRMISDGEGGAYIVWVDDRGSDLDIYIQRLNGYGRRLWDTTTNERGRPVVRALYDQDTPVLVEDGVGGVIVAWTDGRQGHVYVQRIRRDATFVWQVNGRAASTTNQPKYGLTMVKPLRGGPVLAWEESDVDSEVYAQRLVIRDGRRQWGTNGVNVSQTTNTQLSPSLTDDGQGGVIIAWVDYRNDEGLNPRDRSDIYAQRLDRFGVRQWAQGGKPVTTAKGNQLDVNIIPSGEHGALIAWRHVPLQVSKWDTQSGLYATRITGAGTRLSSPNWIRNGTKVANANNSYPYLQQMVTDGHNGAILGWHDYRNTWPDIYNQQINGRGRLGSVTTP